MRVSVSVAVCLALAGFLCAVPPPVPAHSPAAGTQKNQDIRTVSANVTSIGKSSFTLSISSAQILNGSSEKSSGTQSMTFQVDNNTTVDGNLQIGVSAEVTYRIQSVAFNVHVGQ